MKAALLFPPQWTAAQPHSAMASLNGQLRHAGHEVSIWDLNLEYMDAAMLAKNLLRHYQRLQSEKGLLTMEAMLRVATEDKSSRLMLVDDRIQQMDGFLAAFPDPGALVFRASMAALTFRDEEAYYDPARYVDAMLAVDAVLALISLPYFPTEITYNNFQTPLVPFNFEPMLEFCQDDQQNPFRRFYARWIKRILINTERTKLYSITISSFSQVLPGLTLALQLREAFRERPEEERPHLGLGGNFFTRLSDTLSTRPEFFEAFADSIVIGEGEIPIVEQAAALEGDGDLSKVRRLIYLQDGEVFVTEDRETPPMEELPPQDFAGFSLERYHAPDRVACIRASKGCYWGQCTFCDSHFGLERDQISIERLIDEIRFLRDTYGIRHYEFIDQCIEPEYLEKMSDAFIAEELNVRWFCNGRTETGFTKEILEKARQAGATMIMWGVESGSQRLLKLMKKGISTEQRWDVLKRSEEADIWNFAYIFFGFPTETEEEASSTIEMICDNTELIHSYGRSVFTLGRHSPLMNDPKEYGILGFVEDDQEFCTWLSHNVEAGIEGSTVSELVKRCTKECVKAYANPLWMALRARETLHLYLAHHGRDAVKQVRLGVPDESDEPARPPEFVF